MGGVVQALARFAATSQDRLAAFTASGGVASLWQIGEELGTRAVEIGTERGPLNVVLYSESVRVFLVLQVGSAAVWSCKCSGSAVDVQSRGAPDSEAWLAASGCGAPPIPKRWQLRITCALACVRADFEAVALSALWPQVLWQMPHFYALAWIHRADYQRGGYSMFPLTDKTGLETAEMCKPYLVALCALPVAASSAGIASWMLPVGCALPSAVWWRALKRFEEQPSIGTCRRFFLGAPRGGTAPRCVRRRSPESVAHEDGAVKLRHQVA